MRLITRKDKAKNAAQQWLNTYNGRGGWKYSTNGDKEAIYVALVELGPNPDPDDVDRAIGNKSWTECHCDECRTQADEVVEVGEAPDYESATACLCLSCVRYARSFFE